MKALKILSFFAFTLFLISTISATVTFNGYWEQDIYANSKIINNGDSTTFTVAGFAFPESSLNLTIKVYQQSQLIYTFINNQSITDSPCNDSESNIIPDSTCFYQSYTVDDNIYNGAGNYRIVITAIGYNPNNPSIINLYLTVNPLPTDTTAPVITVLGDNPASVIVGSTYTDAGATATDNVDSNVIVTSTGSVNTAVIGTYIITYTATDSSGNSATATRTVNVVDTTTPVITLLGNNPASVVVGSTYTDAGATASDNVDGDITSKIVVTNPVNTAVIGTYTITYSVSDTAGNSATATRTVNVVASGTDTTAPVITVLGDNPASVIVGSTYTDAGATATDNVDSSVTVISTGSVNTAIVETYIITYTATDSSGNSATATRTVNVVASGTDTTAPVITLIGTNPVNVVIGTIYTDAGATATDNVDGNITSRITTSGTVNTAVIGTYTITYSVSDTAGNSATATRTVNVVAKSSSNKWKTNTNVNVVSNSDEEQEYLKQFEKKQIIYLTEDETPSPEQLNSWQKLLKWSPILLIVIIAFLIIGMVFVRR